MGEAETDPDAPRISPFKFIPRPKLSGADAHTAYDDVQKILDDAREKINEAPAPIQVHILKYKVELSIKVCKKISKNLNKKF